MGRFSYSVISIVMCVLFSVVIRAGYGECVHLESNTTDLDGPGSRGLLQDTMTLDCLTFLGIETRDGVTVAQIRDDQGRIFDIQLGDYIGENTGQVVKIEPHAIYVEQIIQSDDKRWLQVERILRRHQD